jgi:hypothetical protein
MQRVSAHQAQVRFVNQRGRLERMAGPFALHVRASHPAQLVVDQGNQLIGRFLVAVAELCQQPRHIAARRRHVLSS